MSSAIICGSYLILPSRETYWKARDRPEQALTAVSLCLISHAVLLLIRQLSDYGTLTLLFQDSVSYEHCRGVTVTDRIRSRPFRLVALKFRIHTLKNSILPHQSYVPAYPGISFNLRLASRSRAQSSSMLVICLRAGAMTSFGQPSTVL